MKMLDRTTLRDKQAMARLREMDNVLEQLAGSPILNKELFMETKYLTLELLVMLFKRVEDNSTPAKTLLDYSRADVVDACFRVGPSNVFENDAEYVISVMKELAK